ncbi:phosphomannomutase, partial [Candidatus Dojkabacteria bacterium]|nr:phosphomannomutase [Candidatus Dojkabacteria bacterium]
MEDTIFRAYDVRGTVPDQLNTQVAYAVAKAYFEITPGSNFIIGYDMRESSLP